MVILRSCNHDLGSMVAETVLINSTKLVDAAAVTKPVLHPKIFDFPLSSAVMDSISLKHNRVDPWTWKILDLLFTYKF